MRDETEAETVAQFVRYELNDGSEVMFEAAESHLFVEHGGGDPEVIEGGQLGRRLHGVAVAAEEVAKSLRERLGPTELQLEFGLKLSGEVNWWFFAKQQAEGTIKVTAKWSATQARTAPDDRDEPAQTDHVGDGPLAGEIGG